MKAYDFKGDTYYRNAFYGDLMYVKSNLVNISNQTVEITYSNWDKLNTQWQPFGLSIYQADMEIPDWVEEPTAPPVPCPTAKHLKYTKAILTINGQVLTPTPFIDYDPQEQEIKATGYRVLKCECGATKCGHKKHSTWCALYKE